MKNARVNVATEEYQIFEWDAPLHGVADKFRLAIRKGDNLIYEEEIDGRKTIAMTKILISSLDSFFYQVIAIDINGQTPNEWQRIVGLQKSKKRNKNPICKHSHCRCALHGRMRFRRLATLLLRPVQQIGTVR